MIVVIDYGVGNVKSVTNAVQHIVSVVSLMISKTPMA
jgi:imidazoleglycerol phosphate synthase glutamine amidotransferase subunit HisH